ncbi:hypothetical protein ACROYT_G013675 [Oculina patagonica]
MAKRQSSLVNFFSKRVRSEGSKDEEEAQESQTLQRQSQQLAEPSQSVVNEATHDCANNSVQAEASEGQPSKSDSTIWTSNQVTSAIKEMWPEAKVHNFFACRLSGCSCLSREEQGRLRVAEDAKKKGEKET